MEESPLPIEILTLLIKVVLQTDLQLPTLAVILINGVRFGRIVALSVLVHGENRSSVRIDAFVFQDTAVVRNDIGLINSPLGIEHISNIHEVER